MFKIFLNIHIRNKVHLLLCMCSRLKIMQLLIADSHKLLYIFGISIGNHITSKRMPI